MSLWPSSYSFQRALFQDGIDTSFIICVIYLTYFFTLQDMFHESNYSTDSGHCTVKEIVFPLLMGDIVPFIITFKRILHSLNKIVEAFIKISIF